MSKIKLLVLPLILLGLMVPSVVSAQEDSVTSDYDYDWEYDWDSYYDDYNYDYSTEDVAAAGAAGIFGLLFAGVGLVISLVVGLGTYIYMSLALMTIGKKLGYENPWFAWIPILNMIMLLKLGDQNPWLLLLALIPGLGGLALLVIMIIAIMKICEKRGFNKMLGLLMLVPLANYVLLGILAWKDKK